MVWDHTTALPEAVRPSGGAGEGRSTGILPGMSEAQKGPPAAAKAVRAVDLVGYQEGAVVSRVILKQRGGNVTLFAFDAGQELSEHTAPFDALVTVLEGEAEVTISGTPSRVAAGEMIVLPANVPHAVRAVGRFKMALTMVKS